jgi:hypothetical protein
MAMLESARLASASEPARKSLLGSSIAIGAYGKTARMPAADVCAIRDYFAHMPRRWMQCLLEDDDLYIEGEDEYEALDVYLKDLGFTGRPVYACLKCRCLYDCDMKWKWKDTVLEKMRCATCGAQLVPYRETQQREAARP